MTLQKRILLIVLVVAALLAVPLAMMLAGADGWHWSPGDFLIMGALLLSTGFAIDFVLHRLHKTAHRILAVAVILAVLALIWIELAVEGVSRLIRFTFG
jgi:Kef-type K+ transport system membrane component KefB